jgi:hypothetical protein
MSRKCCEANEGLCSFPVRQFTTRAKINPRVDLESVNDTISRVFHLLLLIYTLNRVSFDFKISLWISIVPKQDQSMSYYPIDFGKTFRRIFDRFHAHAHVFPTILSICSAKTAIQLI